jgi:hypothetical protein
MPVFKKGQVTNPQGAKPKTMEFRKLQQLCRENAQQALKVICEIMNDPGHPATPRLRAVDMLLGYGFGKPAPVPEQVQDANVLDDHTPQERIEVFEQAIEAERQRLREAN